jgi:hypothetical protein
MIKKIIAYLFVCFFLVHPLRAGDDFCGIRNMEFVGGEEIKYNLYYSVIGLYLNAGTAKFSVAQEKINETPSYHVTCIGTSNSSYDWIFKVRDRYESYFDTIHLQPIKFVRHIEEGTYKKQENILFNQKLNTASGAEGVFKIPNCVQDVVSSIYYLRNIDFNKYKVDERIPFNLFLDNQVYNVYIKYLGKERIKTQYGTFNAIKFKPLLLKGTIFEGGEKMTIWVTDDLNHLPVRIESAIIVGSVKADMMSFKNLRYPLSSLVKAR